MPACLPSFSGLWCGRGGVGEVLPPQLQGEWNAAVGWDRAECSLLAREWREAPEVVHLSCAHTPALSTLRGWRSWKNGDLHIFDMFLMPQLIIKFCNLFKAVYIDEPGMHPHARWPQCGVGWGEGGAAAAAAGE